MIGGGIAGLLTALRLARAGQRVAVVEADRLGSGATCANHGMLHSGALYVGRHGHIVRHCQEAQAPFSALFADAELATPDAVYVIPANDRADFLARLRQYKIRHRETSADAVPEVRSPADHALVAVRERVFSSRQLVATLAAQCLGAGVSVLTGSVVRTITTVSGKVTGVALAGGHLDSTHVVVAAGIGTSAILTRLGSRSTRLLKSRLDTMIHFPGTGVSCGLVFAAPDRPVIMPARYGGALVSFFGGVQPQISGRRPFAVDLDKALALLHETACALSPGTIDPAGAVVYVAGKTDYVGTVHAERGIVNPGFHVIDHEAVDGLFGLHTVITGKMTLAFHASKAVSDTILGTSLPLVLEPGPAAEVPADLAAVEPWAPPAQL